jgi:hypothetical protein
MVRLVSGAKTGSCEVVTALGAEGTGGIPLAKVHRQLDGPHADPRWARFLDRLGLGA